MQVKRLTSEFQDLARALGNTVKGVESSLTGLSEKINRIRVPEDSIVSAATMHFNRLTSQFQDLAGGLGNTVQAVESSLTELAHRINQVKPEAIVASEVGRQVGQATSVLSDLQVALNTSTKSVVELNAHLATRRRLSGSRLWALFSFRHPR